MIFWSAKLVIRWDLLLASLCKTFQTIFLTELSPSKFKLTLKSTKWEIKDQILLHWEQEANHLPSMTIGKALLTKATWLIFQKKFHTILALSVQEPPTSYLSSRCRFLNVTNITITTKEWELVSIMEISMRLTEFLPTSKNQTINLSLISKTKFQMAQIWLTQLVTSVNNWKRRESSSTKHREGDLQVATVQREPPLTTEFLLLIILSTIRKLPI